MTLTAVLDSYYTINDPDSRELRESWEDPIVVLSNVQNSNINPALTTITNPLSGQPTIYVDLHSSAGGTVWRHIAFGLDKAAGKRPLIKINRATKDSSANIPVGYKLVTTQDYETWTRHDTNLVGGTSGTIEFTPASEFPSGITYVATSPLGTQTRMDAYAVYLLANHSAVLSPSAVADVNGVINVSPAETNHNGDQCGGNNQYGFVINFSAPTLDGKRKRKLLLTQGVHAAGESQSFNTFQGVVNWILESADPEASDFRANWDVYLYFCVNPNGTRGGHRRNLFRVATPANGDFSARTLAEVDAIVTAIEADVGSFVDAAFHCHGDVYPPQDDRWLSWVKQSDYDVGTRTPAMQAFITEGTTIFADTIHMSPENDFGTDLWLSKEQLGAKVNFDLEIGAMPSDNSLAWYYGVSRDWMRTLVAVDALNMFVEDLAATNCTQTDTSSTSAITQQHILVAIASEQTDTASTGQINQTHGLTLAGSAQTDASGTGVIGVGGISLAALSCEQTDASSTGSLTQVHALSVVNSVQTDASSTGAITSAGDLAAANCSQTDTSETGTITQTHSITADNSTQTDASSMGAISVGSVISLAAANSTQTDACQTAIITQTHLLIIAPSVQDDVAAASAIVQQHILAGANSEQSDVCSTGSISSYAVVDAPAGSGYRPASVRVSRPGYSPRTRPGSY